MLRPDASSLSARAPERDRGAGVLALGMSLGLHGVALAGLVSLWEAKPPEPFAVIAVELVRAADVAAGPQRDAGSVSGIGQLADKGAPAARDGEPPSDAGTVSAPQAATEAPPWVPPAPRRKPLPPDPSPLPTLAESGIAAKLAELKDVSLASAEQKSPREVTRLEADRVAARMQQSAKFDVGKDHDVAAVPVSVYSGDLVDSLGDGPGSLPRYAGGDLSNAPPRYPYLARRRGQEGRVVLRVQVTAAGDPAAIRVRQSSGYRLLDEAAIAAVKSWRFVPASRAGFPTAGSVDVPVSFKLTDG